MEESITQATPSSFPGVTQRQLFPEPPFRDPRLKKNAEEVMDATDDPYLTVYSKRRFHVSIAEETAAATAATATRKVASLTTKEKGSIATTRHRYAPLASTSNEDGTSTSQSKEQPTAPKKPPLIQAYGILNVRAFAKSLGGAIKSTDFTVQRLGPTARRMEKEGNPHTRGDTCRVVLSINIEIEAAKKFLSENTIAFSTWAEKNDRLNTFVIKGLSSDTTEEEIFEDLDTLGVPVRKVRQLRAKDGKPVALFSFLFHPYHSRMAAGENCPTYQPLLLQD
ncbi:hypothetical protein J437_LFUL018860 [Ladona fulva]|uniref:Uncharacterized protein n=1 Tax=Ladona fulva TaxID=123851 RepID=A0A8K0KRC5_LADFU|nr:hypothetical protein J437_LFUL018860 [Ladona fulva]